MSTDSSYEHLPFGADGDVRQEDRGCVHWPEHALARIDAMARELRSLATLWDTPLEMARRIEEWSGCLDLARLATDAEANVVPVDFAVATRIQSAKDALRLLTEEFARVSRWLSRSAAAGWDGAQPVRPARAMASVLSESHRVVMRDWMWSDLNAQLALSLRLAYKVLATVEVASAALRADLRGACAYGRHLRATADMLVRTGAQAQAFAAFAHEADRRWVRFRVQLENGVTELYAMQPARAWPVLGASELLPPDSQADRCP